MYWDHMTGWGWAMMALFWTLGVALLAGLVWAATRRADGPGSGAQPTARDLLDERLARGEIDADEYRRRRDALEPARRREPA